MYTKIVTCKLTNGKRFSKIGWGWKGKGGCLEEVEFMERVWTLWRKKRKMRRRRQ